MRQELLDELNRFGKTNAEDAEVSRRVFFLLRGFVFFAGILRKTVIECGFLMVSLWWKRGELWCVDGRFLGLEEFPRILDFFGDSHFGNGR